MDKKKQQWISDKIKKLKAEGKSQKQAIAQAISMAEDTYQKSGEKKLPIYQNAGLITTESLNNYGQTQSLNIPQAVTSYDAQGNPISVNPYVASPQDWINDAYSSVGVNPNRRPQIQPIDISALNSSTPDYIQMVNIEEELQKSAQNANQELLRSIENQHEVQNPQQQYYFNPYAGVDIPTAASYLGQSIERKDTLGTVASSLKLATGLGRNIFGAIGAQRRQDQIMQDYRERQRNYITGENNPTYMEEGGKIEIKPFDVYQNGGRKESPLPTEKVMTGEYMTGVSETNQQIEPNSEVEKNEYILPVEGGSIKVEGKTHEQGGEEVELQEGDRIISDHLKLTGKYSKQLKDEFDVKVKAKDTFAKAVDKIYKKIGLQELIDKEEKISKRIIDEEKNTQDATTKNLNLQFLYKEKQKIEGQKQALEPRRQEALETVYAYQEDSKPKEETSDNNFQDGGQVPAFAQVMFEGSDIQKAIASREMQPYFEKRGERIEDYLNRMRPIYEQNKNNPQQPTTTTETPQEVLAPYAITMFEGTPEEKERASLQMQNFFSIDGRKSSLINKRKETEQQFLDRNRTIYDRMMKEGTLDDYKKQNPFTFTDDTITTDEVIYKNGGLKKYQDADPVIGLTGESMALANVPLGQSARGEFFGDVDEAKYVETTLKNPWFDWSSFTPSNEEDVKRFQKEYNERVKKGAKLKVDGKFGEQTQSAYIPELTTEAGLTRLKELQEFGLIPKPQQKAEAKVEEDTTTDNTTTTDNNITTTEAEDNRGTSIIPLLPDQYVMPPGALDPSLKINRRYDRLTPYEISPEQAIVENQRQAQAAYSQVANLPDSQRAAAIAQINANTQTANQRVIQQATTQNAQIANQISAQNARIQQAEQDAAAQDALSYEQRTQTAQAITEEQRQQYMDFMRKLNTQRFNDIRRMNTVNQLFENYSIDPLGNINVQGSTPNLEQWIRNGQTISYMTPNQNQK